MNAVPGERCVLLATVQPDDSSGGDPALITATCEGAEITVENPSIIPGEVAEITVIPNAHAASQLDPGGPEPDYILTAHIAVVRGTTAKEASVDLRVNTSFTDEIAPYGMQMRDRFVPWLAENHPELGITPQTNWTGTMPAPVLVVEHYLYFSDEWEMHVFWHVMIPPYDWARVELRRRFGETKYSLGYEISSRSTEPAILPVPMEPMSELWR